MEATVRATCPQCKTALRIPAQWLGQAVKCKKCGAMVRTKAKNNSPAADDTPSPPPAPTATAPALGTQGNAFNFDQPAAEDDDFFPLPEPAAAPAPVPGPPLDANGYPLPAGYPYPVPPGYAPSPGYPYAPPPGYPYPAPAGYGPPPGYPAPAPGAPYPYPPVPPGFPPPAQHGYAPPPGYGYPQPAPAPAYPAPAPAAPMPAANAPVQPTKLGPVPTKPGGLPAKAAAKSAPPPPPSSNEFKMDSATSRAVGARSTSNRYRRDTGKSKYIWIGLCLLMTAGLVAGGIFGGKWLNDKYGTKETKDDTKAEGTSTVRTGGSDAGIPPKTTPSGFPRRLLFISITKYMYLNPLTQSQPGSPDKTKPAALRLAFDWRVPMDKENNQVFVLSDTLMGPDERLPMKGVVQGTYQEFFKTSRGQDRICIYFGGHAIEKDGKAYIAPMEAELDGEDWEKSVIPLDQFYDEMKKCKATQKVVIWDVCRFNPEKGKVRPGSEPMSEALYKALTTPPAGIQAIVTAKPGENALEFSALRPDGFGGAVYSGSVFLESMKFVAEPKNNRLPKTPPAPSDPLPIKEWTDAIAKRTAEMCDLAEKAGSGGKQSVALAGALPGSLTPLDASEKAAARFEFPHPPKGASQAEIKSVEREFNLPPLKPGLNEIGLGDFPFPADVMKDYASDGVTYEMMTRDKEKYAFRLAVVNTLNKIRDKWTSGSGATKIRTKVEGPIDDKKKAEIKSEQNFWAKGAADLEVELIGLEAVADKRDSEPKRWQAHYDFALASVKARLAYMNEYNKLLGNLITESLPTLDPKLGQDGYLLIASDTLKSGKDVKKWAEDAHALFQEIAVKYKGTPWAIQAKQEKSVTIGLNWKAASLKKE